MNAFEGVRYRLPVFFLCTVASWAQAANVTVNNISDSGSGSAANCAPANADTCTLRDALAAAASGDTVVFGVGSSQTITLVSVLTLSQDVTIDGADSPGLIVSGNDSTRVFYVNSGVTAVLAHVTVAHGFVNDNGAGIYNLGNLTVDAATIVGNHNGAGIGTCNCGGGIFNAGGTASVTNSTLANNSSVEGGGIDSTGPLTVTNSTFVGNSATDFAGGGAIYVAAIGSGTVTNSLFSGNTANTSGGSISGPHISADHNLYWNTDSIHCYNCTSDTNAVNADPGLGDLVDNGGPTQTYLPDPGGAAIDAGLDSACPAADQRGIVRPQGSHCDIGATERQATQCDGVLNSSTAFSETFSGSSLNPAYWTANDNGATVSVSGDAVALSSPSNTTFPYITSSGSPIPATGAFSVRWRATYNSEGGSGDGTLVLSVGAPADGGGTDIRIADAWQDVIGYRVEIFDSQGGNTAVYLSGTPAVQHDVEYCWLPNTTEVWVDGTLQYNQARDPAIARPDSLWFGNPVGTNAYGDWNPFTLYYTDVISLNTDKIFANGFGPAPAYQ